MNRIKPYEKSLAGKGNNSYALNNYSYYLSLRSKDLEKAEKMAKKSSHPGTSEFFIRGYLRLGSL